MMVAEGWAKVTPLDDNDDGYDGTDRGLPREMAAPGSSPTPLQSILSVVVQQCKSKHPHLTSMQKSAASLGSIWGQRRGASPDSSWDEHCLFSNEIHFETPRGFTPQSPFKSSIE